MLLLLLVVVGGLLVTVEFEQIQQVVCLGVWNRGVGSRGALVGAHDCRGMVGIGSVGGGREDG